ncbi:hypothetical protein MNEG_2684 [Monoraphidium neglectum]|uniref:Uncharacterized protein n=1 Tax=Monoraphidium neglectum TaxID=145388 RepID=A0A0D2LF31_9CHLO|nr:hypothetical protein MNEG_2684 [Monoraphidium neglectum]KIZ05279.1 hypothetical protein MNEG_2684 [Monoraphidium neglectum]|eukprot:XP_013904298.1 hypothetical protein MNEG_2684 [Monoraphidium neglectum]
MARSNPKRTATQFRDWAQNESQEKAQDPEHEDSEHDDGKQQQRSFTQQVVRAIYIKWRAQAKRVRDYRRLFALIAFIGLLLGVLHAQRGAATAFRVHSTLSSVVGLDGNAATMQSSDGIYDWLGGVLTAVWKDPVCGDGLCETPFEFASYGRFGCRADCGNLIDLQSLMSLDIDLYYNFGHQTGSLPAAELLSQASWNLCPEKIQYSSDCYYQDDQGFDAIAGTLHVTLPDIPDGSWTLRVKRDLMSKVSGAVRSTADVARAAVWTKVYVAEAAVAAEQAFEQSLLQKALDAARTPFLSYLPTLWTVTRATARDAFDAQQMHDATCVCGAGATAALQGTAGFVDEATWQAGTNCTGVTQLSNRVWYANGSYSIVTPASVDATICAIALANLTAHRATLNTTMLRRVALLLLGGLTAYSCIVDALQVV